MAKKVKETIMRPYVDIHWEGECPICGEKQRGNFEGSVDTLCANCREAQRVQRLQEKQKNIEHALTGAVIKTFGVDRDGEVDFLMIENNGKIYDIEACDECMIITIRGDIIEQTQQGS